MNRTGSRIVALFIVPCLLMDPVLSWALTVHSGQPAIPLVRSAWLEEALALPASSQEHHSRTHVFLSRAATAVLSTTFVVMTALAQAPSPSPAERISAVREFSDSDLLTPAVLKEKISDDSDFPAPEKADEPLARTFPWLNALWGLGLTVMVVKLSGNGATSSKTLWQRHDEAIANNRWHEAQKIRLDEAPWEALVFVKPIIFAIKKTLLHSIDANQLPFMLLDTLYPEYEHFLSGYEEWVWINGSWERTKPRHTKKLTELYFNMALHVARVMSRHMGNTNFLHNAELAAKISVLNFLKRDHALHPHRPSIMRRYETQVAA